MALAAAVVRAENVAVVELEAGVLVVMVVMALLEPLLFNTQTYTQMQHLQQVLQVTQILAETKHIHGKALGLLHGKPIRDKNINL